MERRLQRLWSYLFTSAGPWYGFIVEGLPVLGSCALSRAKNTLQLQWESGDISILALPFIYLSWLISKCRFRSSCHFEIKHACFWEVHLELFWLPCWHEVVLSSSYEDLPLHTLFLITCQSWCGVMFFLTRCLMSLWLWNVNLKCPEFSPYPYVPRTNSGGAL